jgi:hypothetical protein
MVVLWRAVAAPPLAAGEGLRILLPHRKKDEKWTEDTRPLDLTRYIEEEK